CATGRRQLDFDCW
nr:immunoglobulin heavy chain junction region [Macaca mulatta]